MRNQYFTIQINGEPFHCINKMSLDNVLSYLEIDLSFSLVEYNNEIIPDDRLQLPASPLDRAGDWQPVEPAPVPMVRWHPWLVQRRRILEQVSGSSSVPR